MTDVSVKAEVKYNEEAQKALEEKQAYVQMYQQGFLDGWMSALGISKNRAGASNQKRELNIWKRISSKCEERFNFRFMRKIGRNIKRIRGVR